MRSSLSFFLLLPVLFAQCQAEQEDRKDPAPAPDPDQRFKDYWYAGKAELSRYKLQQRRYGEIRKGDALMVFVTEPFLVNSQVKKERATDEASTKVLKLNLTKDFVTGIYDYHMMTSIFDPVDRKGFDGPLKMTTSSQEWCGHSFMQLNDREKGYRVEGRSYFQDEGDVDTTIGDPLLEDEIWTRIRLAPENLPEGAMKLFPSGMSIRLMHQGLRTRTAELAKFKPRKKDSIYPGGNLTGYKIHYQNPERIIRIFYEKEFPHRIAGWEERLVSKHVEPGKKLRVRAVRTHQIRIPYWEKNAKKHRDLRKKLGLNER
ncbi:MAG: septum formation inhibitor Maf [Flavobacteriales bacterium]